MDEVVLVLICCCFLLVKWWLLLVACPSPSNSAPGLPALLLLGQSFSTLLPSSALGDHLHD
jgi:hypothetical protein